MSKDKYKDPVNKRILEAASKNIAEFKRYLRHRPEVNSTVEPHSIYRVGVYAGMNIALKNLGREPL